MSKIFCIMGKSCVGKDTIFKRLMQDIDLNIKPIITYTTRPRRLHETNGVEYYFIDEEELRNYQNIGKLIEVREYDTVNGKWYYGTVDDGKIDLLNHNYLVIVTLEGYKSFREYFGKNKVIPIYITIDDGTRLERALKRERKQKKPNYDELCRRFIADNSDFEIKKLKDNNIERNYKNYNFENCYMKIKNDILIQL